MNTTTLAKYSFCFLAIYEKMDDYLYDIGCSLVNNIYTDNNLTNKSFEEILVHNYLKSKFGNMKKDNQLMVLKDLNILSDSDLVLLKNLTGIRDRISHDAGVLFFEKPSKEYFKLDKLIYLFKKVTSNIYNIILKPSYEASNKNEYPNPLKNITATFAGIRIIMQDLLSKTVYLKLNNILNE